MNIWTEHRNPEGRTYWFNTGSRESVWEKSDDLKTPFERALNQTKWKEYFSGGRKYYYNTDTKESKWDMPDELLLVLEKVEKDGQANQPPPPSLVLNGTDSAVGPHTGGLPFAPSSILPARPNLPDDPVIPHNGFVTVEEGEKAFMHLLRKAGVDANWTWDQTMRAIITDPLYKALNTLAEKKAAWQKFTDTLKAKEQEEREARLSKLRPALRNMLKGNPNVFHYTTFATADKIFSQHPIWQQAKIEAERKLIFEEYVAELKQREVQETRAARGRSISKVVSLFKQLDVDVVTRWRAAHTLVLESEEWKNDAELRKLPTLDILLAFEDYSRVREREFEEQMRRSQVEKTRKERKAREAFKELLRDLADAGRIKARTKWKEIYPSFANDERYQSMLGNPGSNPLELFWDLVDTMDQKLDAKIAVVEEAILRHNSRLHPHGQAENTKGEAGFVIGPKTTRDMFQVVIKGDSDESVKNLNDNDLSLVFETLHDQAVKKQADERRRAERKQRHLQDDLRYALKKLPEPLDITIPYEEAVALIEHLPEYKALEDDDGRRAAFSKFVKRQKERLREASDDGASTTSRKRKEPPRDHREERGRDRDRDREEQVRERGSNREREPHRERGKEHERESRSSRHLHRGNDEYDGQAHRSSRDYPRDRDRDREREKDHPKENEVEKEREPTYRLSKHPRELEKEDRRRDRKAPRSDYSTPYGGGRDWEEVTAGMVKKDRSASAEPREKRDTGYDDNEYDNRSEKRPRYEREAVEEAMDTEREKRQHPPLPRAETPEEGEI